MNVTEKARLKPGVTPRFREINEALPPGDNLFDRDTYSPARDNAQGNVRPGADNHKSFNSKGYLT